MTIIEFKGWIEDLVNQVSSTDWWANGIAIFCAIIGVTVPIIYEMFGWLIKIIYNMSRHL